MEDWKMIMSRRHLFCAVLLLGLVAPEPHLLYSIWSTLLYDTERLDIPVPSNIEIIAYDVGLRGREFVLSDEDSFYEFMESQDSQRLRDRMETLTRFEAALLLYDAFTSPQVVRRARFYPSYVSKVRVLLLTFSDQFVNFKDSAVRQLEELWHVHLACKEVYCGS
jgi:hypothetical protein